MLSADLIPALTGLPESGIVQVLSILTESGREREKDISKYIRVDRKGMESFWTSVKSNAEIHFQGYYPSKKFIRSMQEYPVIFIAYSVISSNACFYCIRSSLHQSLVTVC